ncbi:MAG: PAS domain S-box protein, partial [Deltaproteobacteria bacterium]|nr:PAS domain S-box protein [Deltaproteobacteria bacterium]
MARALTDAGYAVQSLSSLGEGGERGIDEALILVVGSAEEILALRRLRAQKTLPLLVGIVAGEELDDREAELLTAGLDDVQPWPKPVEAFALRLGILRKRGNRLRDLERRRGHRQLLDETADEFDLGTEVPEAIHEALVGLEDHTEASRALLLVRRASDETCYLLGASDDSNVFGLVIPSDALGAFPQVYDSRQDTWMDEEEVSPRLAVYGGSASKEIKTVLWQPLSWDGSVFGALELHFERETDVNDASRSLFRGMSSLLAPRIRFSESYRNLHEQTQRRGIARLATQGSLAVLQKYREFFARASDGIVVLGHEGNVLYLNPMGEQITGYADHGLVGQPFYDIIVNSDREMLRQRLTELPAGRGQIFDVHLVTTSGDPIVASVSMSAGLATDEMRVLSFRDVTEARALSEELRQTKEFLERLIDSAVDAIVAADIEGRVILFNQGAERIFGYRNEDVIGQRSLEDLYPPGVAAILMQQLRSQVNGDVGRLEMARKDAVDTKGELVPVRISASIIYENGSEVGTVSIISDLRERLHMERRLVQAQERLVDAEKQALIAELAGTTAHELNQPLTSVMGYAELLQRRIPEDDSNRRAADKILQECQRLADIVRQIGKITRYETKTYVGGTQILDLD